MAMEGSLLAMNYNAQNEHEIIDDLKDPDVIEVLKAEKRLKIIAEHVTELDKTINEIIQQRQAYLDEKAEIMSELKTKMKSVRAFLKQSRQLTSTLTINNGVIEHYSDGDILSESEYDDDIDDGRDIANVVEQQQSSKQEYDSSEEAESRKKQQQQQQQQNHNNPVKPSASSHQSEKMRFKEDEESNQIMDKTDRKKKKEYLAFLESTRSYLDNFAGTKAYPPELKAMILYFADSVGMKRVSREIGISYANVRSWKKKLLTRGHLERKPRSGGDIPAEIH